jgi:hypothetical protein
MWANDRNIDPGEFLISLISKLCPRTTKELVGLRRKSFEFQQ